MNSKGPVPAPLALRCSSPPRSCTTLGETIMPARSVSVASSAASGRFRLILIVWESTTSTESMLATSPLRTDLGSVFMRSKLNFAASAVKSLPSWNRSEEHTSELQSLAYLVCRLLLEKKNTLHKFTVDVGDAEVAALETVGEVFVVQAHAMQ